MFSKKSSFCKILHAVVQRLCKGFDKGTTARGTGFIKLYTVYSLIFDFNTFHILPANIQDTVYFRVKECSGIVVRNCFYLSFVQKKGSFDQCFSVSGRTGIGNMSVFRHQRINFLNGTDGSF